MTPSYLPRIAACFLLSAVLLSVLTGCTKRIDTSTQDKYYKTLTEVMDSLPASKHREFDDGNRGPQNQLPFPGRSGRQQ